MREAVRTRIDYVDVTLRRKDVDNRHLPAKVCGLDNRDHDVLRHRRESRTIVIEDLDVVGALRDALIDECLRLIGGTDRLHRRHVFHAVATGDGYGGARSAEIGDIEYA